MHTDHFWPPEDIEPGKDGKIWKGHRPSSLEAKTRKNGQGFCASQRARGASEQLDESGCPKFSSRKTVQEKLATDEPGNVLHCHIVLLHNACWLAVQQLVGNYRVSGLCK